MPGSATDGSEGALRRCGLSRIVPSPAGEGAVRPHLARVMGSGTDSSKIDEALLLWHSASTGFGGGSLRNRDAPRHRQTQDQTYTQRPQPPIDPDRNHILTHSTPPPQRPVGPPQLQRTPAVYPPATQPTGGWCSPNPTRGASVPRSQGGPTIRRVGYGFRFLAWTQASDPCRFGHASRASHGRRILHDPPWYRFERPAVPRPGLKAKIGVHGFFRTSKCQPTSTKLKQGRACDGTK